VQAPRSTNGCREGRRDFLTERECQTLLTRRTHCQERKDADPQPIGARLAQSCFPAPIFRDSRWDTGRVQLLAGPHQTSTQSAA
jgi:hypothetical protein